MVRVFRPYSNEEWNTLSASYIIEQLESTTPLNIDDLPNNSPDNLCKRSSSEYPGYLYDGFSYLSSTPFLQHCSDVLTIPNSHQIYSLSGLELPLAYSSYEEYICSKTLWSSGHNSSRIHAQYYSISNIDPTQYCHRTDSHPVLILRRTQDHDNYWHWVFDAFPSIFYYVSLSTCCNPVLFSSILLTNSPTSFQLEMLELVQQSLRRQHCEMNVFCKTSNLLHQNLYIPHLSSPLIHNWPLLRKYQQYLLDISNLLNKPCKDKLLYVRRGSTRNGRHLINESELEHALMLLGFTIIDCSNHSVLEQWSLFRESSLVLGVHGSAFVNILFMHPGSHVVELLGPSYLPVHDFLLSAALNLNYSELPLSLATNQSTFSSDYTCDVADIISKVQIFIT